ncbi:hypothetical protein [Nocardiopsis dassonvillei]
MLVLVLVLVPVVMSVAAVFSAGGRVFHRRVLVLVVGGVGMVSWK